MGHAFPRARADVLHRARAPRPVEPRLQRGLRPEQPLRRTRPMPQPPGTDDEYVNAVFGDDFFGGKNSLQAIYWL